MILNPPGMTKRACFSLKIPPEGPSLLHGMEEGTIIEVSRVNQTPPNLNTLAKKPRVG
jgi:hypothetical protein